MATHLSVSEVARRLHCRPRDISDLFYQRMLDDERCPIVGGRRLIPTDFVPAIERLLLRLMTRNRERPGKGPESESSGDDAEPKRQRPGQSRRQDADAEL